MPKSGSVTYSVHPSVAYVRAILDKLPDTTGRSIEDWAKAVRKSGLKESAEIRGWLKREHALGATTASMVADYACGLREEITNPEAYLRAAGGYVDAMYEGGKAGLRPLHDALLELARSMGTDVKICPCQTIVPLYRNHVFAQIKPSTRTRVDLGLALKGVKRKLTPRLIDTGGLAKGDRITHRIPIQSIAEIDNEVTSWLHTAYELDG